MKIGGITDNETKACAIPPPKQGQVLGRVLVSLQFSDILTVQTEETIMSYADVYRNKMEKSAIKKMTEYNITNINTFFLKEPTKKKSYHLFVLLNHHHTSVENRHLH